MSERIAIDHAFKSARYNQGLLSGILSALVLGGYLSLLSIILIKGFGVSPVYDERRIVIGTIYGAIFFFVTLQATRYFGNRRLHAAAYIALSVYSVVYFFLYAYHFLLYGQLFGEPAVGALLDTNPGETTEFLVAALDWQRNATAGLLALLPALLLVLAYRRADPAKRRPRLGVALSVLALAMLVVGIASRQTSQYNQFFMPTRSIATVLYYRHQVLEMQNAMAPSDLGAVVAPAQEAATHVLVIGESTTRNHMSLYGFGRDTTPRLDSLEKELFVARDTCSSRGSTAAALQEFLTLASRDNHEALFKQSSLVPVMNAAGFETWWISNQQMYGKFDSWSAVFSQKAAHRIFTNKVGWTDGVSLDGALIDPLKAALANPAKHKFIVVHLLGTHSEYRHRYPPAFDRFSGAPLPHLSRRLDAAETENYNTYDNAVLYTDHVVAEVIEATRAAGGRATVTFLSDHGEALGEHSRYAGHIEGSTARQVYEIPLLFWMSPTQSAEIRRDRPRFEANLSQPFQIDGFLNTLLDLYRIGHPGFEAERSLLSSTYRSGPRFCDQLDASGDAVRVPVVSRETARQP